MASEMNPKYKPKSSIDHLGYLVEEAGEVLAAAGKSLRWGLDSWNPELKPTARESNEQWLQREMHDLSRAIYLMTEHLNLRAIEDGRIPNRPLPPTPPPSVPIADIEALLSDLRIHGLRRWDTFGAHIGVDVIARLEALISNAKDEAEHPADYR